MHPMGVADTSNGVTHTFKGDGAYIKGGWHIHPMGVTHTSKGGGAYIQGGTWRLYPMG